MCELTTKILVLIEGVPIIHINELAFVEVWIYSVLKKIKGLTVRNEEK